MKDQRAYDYHNRQNVNMNCFHVTSTAKEPFKGVVDSNMDNVKLQVAAKQKLYGLDVMRSAPR